VTKGKLDWRVKREIWVSREKEVYPDHLANKEPKDLKDQRELKGHLEKLELLDHQEKKAKKDPQDSLDIQEGLGIKETKEPKEGMEHLEEKEKGVKMVFKERGGKLDQEDSGEELGGQEVSV